MKPKRCQCDWCVRVYPSIQRIRRALKQPLRQEFDDLMLDMAHHQESGAVAQAKLDGEWPGWEWLKQAIAERKKSQS